MTEGTWAIVPVKRLSEAKSRLAAVLTDELRQRLVRMMLEDVLGALSATVPNSCTLVVTPDPEIEGLARGHRVEVLREREVRGLNGAVATGLVRATGGGATQVLIVPGDVPLATGGEFVKVLGSDATERERVVLVPAADGGGTNAMLLAPPDIIRPSFGPDSFVRHLAAAAARRIDTQFLHLPGLAADIDTPVDLRRLVGPGAPPRYAFLRTCLGKPEAVQSPARRIDP